MLKSILGIALIGLAIGGLITCLIGMISELKNRDNNDDN